MSNEQIMNTLLGVVGTNKSYLIGDYESSQVVFKVNSFANKTLVKKAVSHLFDVGVVSVNILNCKGKVICAGIGKSGLIASRYLVIFDFLVKSNFLFFLPMS